MITKFPSLSSLCPGLSDEINGSKITSKVSVLILLLSLHFTYGFGDLLIWKVVEILNPVEALGGSFNSCFSCVLLCTLKIWTLHSQGKHLTIGRLSGRVDGIAGSSGHHKTVST